MCKKFIFEQGVPEDNIIIITEAPHTAALRKSFQIGIERGLPWTLSVDADVLLRKNSITRLVDFAEKQSKHVCEIQGMVLDKLFGGARPGGAHLYRTNLLNLALEQIPEEGIDLRSETYMLRKMHSLGYPWYNISLLVGLHDFEQYYLDIFRKCFVQAHKNLSSLDFLVPYWRRMIKEDCDTDFEVALSGVNAGITYYGEVFINVKQPIYRELFAKTEFVEKDDLNIDQYSINDLEAIINKWQEPLEYIAAYPEMQRLDSSEVKVVYNRSLSMVIKDKIKDIGYLWLLPWMLGWILKKVGTKICDLFER